PFSSPPRPPSAPRFPYTALFRSRSVAGARRVIAISEATRAALARHYPRHVHKASVIHHGIEHQRFQAQLAKPAPRSLLDEFISRSEEHTSELQSREKLVCRLLLE